MNSRFARFTSFPRASTIEDYARASSELEDALIALPGIVAVYRYGSVTVPGISDLDRVAVVEDSRPVEPIWSSLSGDTRYLAMHTPALVDVSTFLRHRWFAEMSGLERVWGEALRPEERPIPEHSEPLLAAEALIVSAVKLAKLAFTRYVKVRSFLCELRNVELDLRLARIDRPHAPRAWSLADEVEIARNEWWSLSEAGRLTRLDDLVSRAPGAIVDAINAVGEAHGDPSFGGGPIRLGGGWDNVALVPAGAFSERRFRSLVPPVVIERSRRLGEALWRWQSRHVVVPASVIGLVAGEVAAEYTKFQAERTELVTRHAAHLAGSPGYSGIAMGTVFVQQ